MRNPRRNVNTTVENTKISGDLLNWNVWVCVDKVVSLVGSGCVGIVVHIEDAGDMTGFVRLRMGLQRILGGRVLLLEVCCGTLLQTHAEIVDMENLIFLDFRKTLMKNVKTNVLIILEVLINQFLYEHLDITFFGVQNLDIIRS